MKFLIHAHVYYKELWEELAACVRNCMPDADLYVTTPHDDDELRQKVISAFPRAHYAIVENRGYDIAPFLETIASVDLSQYEYVIKLHTKRNVWTWLNLIPMPAGRWRRCLLRFCATRKNVEKCLQRFNKDKRIGMICGHYALILKDDESGVKNGSVERAEEIVHDIGLRECQHSFVAGSMFMARAMTLSKIALCTNQFKFEISDRIVHEGMMAHAYERAIGYTVSSQEYRIVDFENSVCLYSFIRPMLKTMFIATQWSYRKTIKPLLKHSMFYR